VTVLFNVDQSAVLSAEQRELLRQRLGSRIGRTGVLRVSSQRHRTQLANRDAAVLRLAQLLREALTEKPERVPVTVSQQAKGRRLEQKRHRAGVKRGRSFEPDLDE
jgi:ribosome-associated protein